MNINEELSDLNAFWLKTIDCNGYPSQRIKKLTSFSVKELEILRTLIKQVMLLKLNEGIK